MNEWLPDEAFGEGGRVYGLSHECAVPMREFAAPSEPPEGGTSSETTAVNVSVRFTRCSSLGGGTIATWPSLDGGGSTTVLLAEDMDDGWESLPLYWHSSGDFQIFILNSGNTSPAPQVSPELGFEDQRFVDALETEFATINQQVNQNQIVASNAPPPSVPDPSDRVFWRIKADWNLDTDADGSPDWAEFEMYDDPNHPSHPLGEPFNGDVDGNGVADGQQIDYDKDQVPDVLDQLLESDLVSVFKNPSPRYALFPVDDVSPPDNAKKPIQINDRGTVLYANGTWSGGKWEAIKNEEGDLTACEPRGLNDFGEIVGIGQYDVDADGGPVRVPVVVRWPQPNEAPEPVVLEESYAHPPVEFASGILAPGTMFSNDGKIIAQSVRVDQNLQPPAKVIDEARHIWTLGGNGREVVKGDESQGMSWIIREDTCWGRDAQTQEGIFISPGSPGKLFEAPMNLVWAGNSLHAFYQGGLSAPETFKNGAWKKNFSVGKAIDMSADGTAIGANQMGIPAPLFVNGELRPLADYLSGGPAEWTDNSVSLIDTTPRGWILAKRGAELSPEVAALLPLRLEGEFQPSGTPPPPILREGVGVDGVSMMSSDPPAGTLNRIWIMAPSGSGETKVKIKAPASSTYPLELSAEGLEFGGEDPEQPGGSTKLLTEQETVVSIKAAGNAQPGQEIPITLKLKNGDATVESLTTPLAAKVMKRRTIRVWRVKSDSGELPKFNPTAHELETYLNNVFQPQINAVFDCQTSSVVGPVNWDTAIGANFQNAGVKVSQIASGNKKLDLAKDFKNEITTIRSGNYVSAFSVNLYLVGGAESIEYIGEWNSKEEGVEITDASGVADVRSDHREAWIPADRPVPQSQIFDTIAHEIGHVIIGGGHPNEGGGVAVLPRTDRLKRLMCSGDKSEASPGRYKDGTSRVIVKKEWDNAVSWLANEIEKERIPE